MSVLTPRSTLLASGNRRTVRARCHPDEVRNTWSSDLSCFPTHMPLVKVLSAFCARVVWLICLLLDIGTLNKQTSPKGTISPAYPVPKALKWEIKPSPRTLNFSINHEA